MSDQKNEVWLSGDETIHFVSELFSGPIDPRATGRTIRLALRYTELALKVAPARVQIEDHFSGQSGQDNLARIIGKIFDAINIDYKIQEVKHAQVDPSRFTGTYFTGGKTYYLTAEPRGLKAGDYTVPTA